MVYLKKTAKPRWNADEIKGFCGWEFLQKMVALAGDPGTERLIVVAFLTGSRISEVLQTKHQNFDFGTDPKMVVVRAMPIVKRYEKIGVEKKWRCLDHCKMRWGGTGRPREPTPKEYQTHNIIEYTGWRTRPKNVYRTFPFPKAEPLVPSLEKSLEGLDGSIFDFKYSTAYKKVTKIGKELNTWIPTHWFRAQRASQLAFEYGFREYELTKWFIWRDYETAFHYARMGYKELALKMVK